MTDRPAARDLPSIRRYLLARVVGIVVFSFVVFALAAWLFVLRPSQDELARVEMDRTGDQVENQIRALTDQIERMLVTSREWGRSGLLRLNRPHDVAALMIPVLRTRPQLSQVLIADERGRSFQFGRGDDGGGWLIREMDPVKLGGQQHWIHLNEDGGFLREQWVERERFDARTRPWYQGAAALARDDGIHWTEPYPFFASKDPGITAAMRWTDRNTGARLVVAIDVLLLDLSRYTTHVVVAEHGRAAILSADGKVIGVPRHPDVQTDDDIRQRILKTPADAGLVMVAAAHAQWLADGRPAARAAFFSAGGETWLGRFRPFALRNQQLLIGMVAPRSDFALFTLRDAALIAAMMALVLLAAFYISRRLAERFGRLADNLAAESERIGNLQLDEPVRMETATREFAKLADSQERMRLMLLEATRGLEDKVRERTAELAEALERQRAIFTASPYGICVFRDRRFVLSSPSFERMFGYGPGEVVGRSARILFRTDEDFEQVGAQVYAATGGGRYFAYEIQMRRKDASDFWCRVTAAPLAGEQGERGIVALYEDITPRKQAEEALHSANERLDLAQEASNIGVWDVEIGGRNIWSPQLERMFGLKPGTFPGTVEAWAALLHPEDRERSQRIFSDALADPAVNSYVDEFRVIRPDGEVRWFHTVGRIYRGPDGTARRSVGVNVDMTELIAARRTAEDATHAKSMFLASMSHEIRTPMNGVMGLLQLLGFSKLDAEQRATVDGARDSARSLLRIIDDLLDFSKIEAGKLEIRPEVASVAGVLESVRQVYSGVASAKDLALRTSLDPGISPAHRVDPLRLRQILNNFVSNAIKFTEKGGVEIVAALAGRRDGCDVVRLSVTDTGIGVPGEAQTRLFQPYVQAAADTARRFGGTGLGLTICRRLADMMGGSIAMQSEVGKGTTMTLTLTLPIADARELPKSSPGGDAAAAMVASRRRAPDVEAAREEGTLVLIAEDHPTNRNLLTRLLALLGYAAEAAENGHEAIEKWQSGRYGAILTDCNMPEMDGYELARAVRARESGGGSRIPIIACTANALAGEAERCIQAGMDDFVAKPVELEALARAMDRWLPLQDAGQRAAAPWSAAPAEDAGAPVDRSSLATVSGGDAATAQAILADFKAANDADMSALRSALAERDIAKVTHASHRVKGACKMVGAVALATVCERMEQAGRRNSWQDVAAEQAALEREFERLNAWLNAN